MIPRTAHRATQLKMHGTKMHHYYCGDMIWWRWWWAPLSGVLIPHTTQRAWAATSKSLDWMQTTKSLSWLRHLWHSGPPHPGVRNSNGGHVVAWCSQGYTTTSIAKPLRP